MLLDKKAGTIAYERANTVRSVEYMRNMISEGPVNDRITEVYEQSMSFDESAEDQDILRHFHADGDEDKDTEIQRILESAEDMSFDEMIGLESVSEDFYTEGANLEIMKIKRTYIKTLKSKMREAKIAAKMGDKKKAISLLKDVKSDLKKIEDYVQDIDSTLLETAIGQIIHAADLVVLSCVAIGGTVFATTGTVTGNPLLIGIGSASIVGGYVGSLVQGFKKGFRAWMSILDEAGKGGGFLKAYFGHIITNTYKSDTVMIVKDLQKVCDNTIKALDKNPIDVKTIKK